LKTLALIGQFDDGIGEFLSAVDATKGYSLLLHCTLGEKSNLGLLLLSLRKWFSLWNTTNLPPWVGSRRVDIMASLSRFRLHNQIPGNDLSNEWFRVFFNWRRLHPILRLRKLQESVLNVFAPILEQTRSLCISPGEYDEGFICCPGFWQYFRGVRTLRFLGRDDGVTYRSTTAYFINALCNDLGTCLILR
jgi:hypothetical protein